MKKKILIVDDDPSFRAYLCAILKGQYIVSEAENGESGLAKAEAEDSDLVITDLIMPLMNGLEMINNLRETYQKPIFVVSGSSIEPSTAFDFGANLFLAKPFSPETLKDYVAQSLASPKKAS